jgi:predicted membrane protein
MGARNIVPLILLLVFVGILAAVGYVVYSIVQDVSKNTREKMERKNIAFTKDGMKVQVREIKDEAYKDQTQRYVCFFLLWSQTD